MKLISSIATALLCFSFILSPNVLIAEETDYKPARLDENKNKRVKRVLTTNNESEYWTHIHFIVDQSGNVELPLILDHSEENDLLTDHIQLLKGHKYQPALLDGKPVASGKFYFFLHSVIVGNDQNKSAGERFAKKYGEAVGLVAKNQLEEAEKAIQELKQDFTSNLVRQAWIAWVSSMLDFRRQDYNSYLRNLTIAGYLAEKYLSSSVSAKLYMNLYEMQMYAHHYLDAFDTVIKMRKSDKVNIDAELLTSLLERVNSKLAGDSEFAVNLVLNDEKWQHYRAHSSELNLNWQSGALTGLQLRCPDRIEDYFPQLEQGQQTLKIDALESHCVLLLQGAEDSQVTINIGT